VEHAAAVVVDEAFRQRAVGDDHVMRLELDVEILDFLHLPGLNDRDPLIECFASISTPSRSIAWCGETQRSRAGTLTSSAPLLMQTGRMSVRPRMKRPP